MNLYSMGPTVIVPIAFIVIGLVFGVVIGLAFLWDIIVILLNALVFYVLYFRIMIDYKNEKMKAYFISFPAALLIVFLVGNFLSPLWSLTTSLILTFILAKLYMRFLKE